jgi:hypothetical protein
LKPVTTELVLADQAVQKKLAPWRGRGGRGDKEALAREGVLKNSEPHLFTGKPALTLELAPRKAVAPVLAAHGQADHFCCNAEGERATADKIRRREGGRLREASFRLRSGRHQRAN